MEKYIIFGAGHDGRSLCKLLGKEKVAFFCDNYLSQTIKEIDGIEVIPYEELKRQGAYPVIIASRIVCNAVEIASQLTKDNIPYRLMDDVAKECLNVDRDAYKFSNQRASFDYQEENEYLIPYDKFEPAGVLGSYFWQDLWAARHIFKEKPSVHYDIGSRIDGFIAHLVTFGQRVILLDIRPMEVVIPGVTFIQCNAMNLEEIEDNSIESLSALCSLEHFGLGRYGDPIDPEACFRCFDAIQRKIKKGGCLYISVPVGREHVEFNAHRVFYASTIRACFGKMKLEEYTSVYNDCIEYNIELNAYDDWTSFGGKRFGLFRFEK